MMKRALGRILATVHNVDLALIKQAGFHKSAQASVLSYTYRLGFRIFGSRRSATLGKL
jgi:hypothetical protein